MKVAFFQAVKVLLTKRDIVAKKRSDEEREQAIRQIIGSAVVSEPGGRYLRRGWPG